MSQHDPDEPIVDRFDPPPLTRDECERLLAESKDWTPGDRAKLVEYLRTLPQAEGLPGLT